jgi:hypothetical protein
MAMVRSKESSPMEQLMTYESPVVIVTIDCREIADEAFAAPTMVP